MSDDAPRRRVLVLGSHRHLGAHLTTLLKDAGHEVHGLGDEDLANLPPDLPAYDLVYFCGAETFPADAVPKAKLDELESEADLLGQVLSAHPRRLVLTSSASVYAPTDEALLTEGSGLGPTSVPGQHALVLEQALTAAAEASGVPHAILRCAALAGRPPLGLKPVRRLKRGLVLHGLKAKARYPEVRLRLHSPDVPDHARVADIVHVREAARAHVLAGAHLMEGGESLVLNVGSGVPLTRAEVLAAAAEVDQIKAAVDEAVAAREPAGAVTALSVASAQQRIGWTASETGRRAAVVEELTGIANVVLRKRRLRDGIEIEHRFLGSWLSRRWFSVAGLLTVADTTGTFSGKGVRFEVGGKLHRPRLTSRIGVRHPFKRARLVPYVLRVPRSDLQTLPTSNPVRFVHLDPSGAWMKVALPYSSSAEENAHRRGRIHRMRESGFVVYVRQGISNLYLGVRPRNRTDSLFLAPVIRAAEIAARLRPADTILLYEKHASTYEESASVLFEALVHRGYRTARFVLPRERFAEVPQVFRPYVVPRHSFRHFYHYFSAKALLGTERIFHATEASTASRPLLQRMDSGCFRYVFLQHGVMYMVSLSATQRKWFRSRGVPGSKGVPDGSKVVCSSQLEVRHFVELGGYRPEDLYVTGLPKYDRATRDADADRVLIMPTWRPWEYNLVRIDPDTAPYVRMLKELLAAVPPRLRDRTYVLPHPLIRSGLLSSELAPYLWPNDSYDDALRTCALLITDYSSISYDAFYRGANVVFWWKEKDECMRRYGADLMIDEDTAFGPVCRDGAELTRLIEASYRVPQDAEYARRYRRIVEFHDNRNTERLIGMLERDGIITPPS
ncbi:MAG: CDP-glycerol glycerophosphotransferase family protein [Coriobacteriia bacterium]|nr:CDP-glycerol glycerophosphotransferase family protein [Coriobacteriia bacterium]